MKGTNFVRSIYSKKNIGILTIRILQREQPVQSELNENYHSNIHNETTNSKQLYHFWIDNIKNESSDWLNKNKCFITELESEFFSQLLLNKNKLIKMQETKKLLINKKFNLLKENVESCYNSAQKNIDEIISRQIFELFF